MKVLVTDGENRSALAVTRSLGKRGCRVVVTGRERRNLSSCSIWCHGSFAVPDPILSAHEYSGSIVDIARLEAIDVIFPMTEQSTFSLNQARAALPDSIILACPPQSTIDAVADKSNLCRLAARLRVPYPDTLHISRPDELAAAIDRIGKFPVVIKPSRSKIPLGNGFISARVMYAGSREELERLYATSEVLRHPSVIQELIVGPGTGLFTLYDGDRHLALFSHRRLREKPPSGGVSVLSESVPLDPRMVESAGRLLSAVGWNGVAMVEFKRDIRDGVAKLVEINGRFWGSLQLAIDCGVDFPALLLEYVQGQRPSLPIGEYRKGRKLKWFLGTLDHLLAMLKNGREEMTGAVGFPSRCRAVLEFLKIWEKETSFDVFDWDDRRPFWHEGLSYLRHAARRKR